MFWQVSSHNLRGMRRRCLFNEKAGAANKGVKNTSIRHSASSTTPRRKISSSDNSLKILRTPCALPGIGLHLNALATVPKDKTAPHNDIQTSLNQANNVPSAVGSSPPIADSHNVNDDSSHTTMVAYVDGSSQDSPKKKRYYVYAHYFRLQHHFTGQIMKWNSTLQTQVR